MRAKHQKPDAAGQVASAASQSPLPASLVGLLAVACALSVANVYYAQPLLDAIGEAFAISQSSVGMVVTATQVGCAAALIFVVPLGDLIERRRLLFGQLIFLIVSLLAVAMAATQAQLLVAMGAVGLLGTAMTQGLIAMAAALSPPSQRGQVVGAAQGGVVIGLLLARVFAGVLADMAGWRSVYFTSAGVALGLAVVLLIRLPKRALPQASMAYAALLRSMFALMLRERVLRVRGVIAMLMFAAFSAFWTALVLPLSEPPHSLSHTAIGAFGLVGVAGALAASRAGRWADRGRGERSTGVALVLLCVAWLPIASAPSSLWLLALGVLILDLAVQALHVTNQAMILRVHPEAHSRLVGAYMLFYATGSGLGAIAATHVYAYAGWLGVCFLGAGISVLALVFWAVTYRTRVLTATGACTATAA